MTAFSLGKNHANSIAVSMNQLVLFTLGICSLVAVCGCALTNDNIEPSGQNLINPTTAARQQGKETSQQMPVTVPSTDESNYRNQSDVDPLASFVQQVDYRTDAAARYGASSWSNAVERLPSEMDYLNDPPEGSLSSWLPGSYGEGEDNTGFVISDYFSSSDASSYRPTGTSGRNRPTYWSNLMQDHRNYYSRDNLVPMGLAYAVGAGMANTDIDCELQRWWQDDIRGSTTHDITTAVEDLGEAYYLLPAAGAAMVLGYIMPDSAFGETSWEWGSRSSRALLVGTPPMLLGQMVTGAGRPAECSPRWNPFNDNNGVSGHSFCGAIPFISAAKMTDNTLAKTGLYTCSTLVGLSRMDSNRHYASQVFLGWWMAYSACSAVDRTERENETAWYKVAPMPTTEGGPGVGIVLER